MPPESSAAPGRPNVLLILCDQLRADHLGFGGNPVVATPHLDALAAAGLRCDRAYVSNPICMPNRSTILTGLVPSAHGTRMNGISLAADLATFPRELRRAGYRTGLVGKAHFQNIYSRAGGLAGELDRDEQEQLWATGWDRWEDQNRHRAHDVQMPEDYYGFGHVELAVNHADYVSGHYYQWLRENGYDEPRAHTGPRNAAARSPHWNQIYKPQLPVELYPTTWVAERSVRFITEAAGTAQPWMLQVSFPDPHHPFTPPGRYWDLYDPADVVLPASFNADPAGLPPQLRSWRDQRGTQRSPMTPWAPTEAQFREAAAKEYGAITLIDDAVGSILSSLEATGQRQRTVVVFTSDHGDMFGDHGILLKGGLHFDGCTRVPLVWSGAGIEHGSTAALCGSIDLGPTLLGLAGCPVPATMQGHDLAPVLHGQGGVREACLIEEDEMFDVDAMFDPAGMGGRARLRTIVTAQGRLTWYGEAGRGEAYDLRDDPGETANRWGDPGAAPFVNDLRDRLVDALVEHAPEMRQPTAMA